MCTAREISGQVTVKYTRLVTNWFVESSTMKRLIICGMKLDIVVKRHVSKFAISETRMRDENRGMFCCREIIAVIKGSDLQINK